MAFGLPDSPADILALPRDEVAMRMLRYFASDGPMPKRLNRHDLGNPPSWGNVGNLVAANPDALVRVQEAWDWLVVHGLVTRDPRQGGDWGAVTESGREAARDPRGKARTLAIQRLGVDLHPRLAVRVRPQFLLVAVSCGPPPLWPTLLWLRVKWGMMCASPVDALLFLVPVRPSLVWCTACVRVPDGSGGRQAQLAEFATTVVGLLALAEWLKAYGVTHVAMEATGVYWQPVWHILEEDFELMLVNARHVKNVPGRKTDVSDAQWLCQLMEAGLLRSSFVPPKPQRRLRTLTRYRKTQIAERQREANRLHKALEDTGIKLDCVATDILGKSGRAMLDALVAGTTDPEVLAELAQGKLRAKIPALKEALRGRFQTHHTLVIGAILAHLDFLDGQIDGLSEAIGEQLGPTGLAGVALASTIPGVAARTAEVLVAEIGTDMSIFPSPGHLASWGGQCPGNDQSAGKRRSGRPRKGTKWLGIGLQEAALAAIRSKDTYLAAQYQRLKSRLGTYRKNPAERGFGIAVVAGRHGYSCDGRRGGSR